MMDEGKRDWRVWVWLVVEGRAGKALEQRAATFIACNCMPMLCIAFPTFFYTCINALPPSFRADDDASKAVIRSVCMILDAFHFPLPAEGEEEGLAAGGAAPGRAGDGAGAAAQPAAVEAEAEADAEMEMEADLEPDADMGDAAAGAVAALSAAHMAVPAGEVHRMLARRVVPELQRIMVEKDNVRAPVALAGEQAALLGWAGVADWQRADMAWHLCEGQP